MKSEELPGDLTYVPIPGNSATLGKESFKIRCAICQTENFTRVENKITKKGIIWVVLWGICGSWLLALMAVFLDAFREFKHFCPSCNAHIGTYKAEFSNGWITLLVLLGVGTILLNVSLVIVSIYLYLLPNIYFDDELTFNDVFDS